MFPPILAGCFATNFEAFFKAPLPHIVVPGEWGSLRLQIIEGVVGSLSHLGPLGPLTLPTTRQYVFYLLLW